MSTNSFTGLLALETVLSLSSLQEKRAINNASGQILYLGISLTPNADTSLPIWMVLKFEYDSNGFFDHQQLPDDGAGYIYVWDDVSTYFSI